MKNEIYKYIVKWEGGKQGHPILFFPEASANAGRIVCYVHMGQHSEADMTYYWGLKNIPVKDAARWQEANDLISEYQGFMNEGETMQRVHRDNQKMRNERWERKV